MTPELRPLGIGETLDVAIKVYRSRFWDLIKIVALVIVPVQIVSALVTFSVIPEDARNFKFDPDTFQRGDSVPFLEPATLTGFGIVILLIVLSSQLATGASLKSIGDAYLGRRAKWAESLSFAASRLGSIVWISAIAFFGALVPGLVATALGFLHSGFLVILLAVVPVVVWLFVSWAIAIPALLVEDIRGTRALGRSFKLVSKRWWKVAITLLLSYILTGIVGNIFGLVFGVVVPAASGSDFAGILATLVGDSIGRILTTPFVAATLIVLYFDLRVRKEGFDIEMLAASTQAGAVGKPGLGSVTGWESHKDSDGEQT